MYFFLKFWMIVCTNIQKECLFLKLRWMRSVFNILCDTVRDRRRIWTPKGEAHTATVQWRQWVTEQLLLSMSPSPSDLRPLWVISSLPAKLWRRHRGQLDLNAWRWSLSCTHTSTHSHDTAPTPELYFSPALLGHTVRFPQDRDECACVCVEVGPRGSAQQT